MPDYEIELLLYDPQNPRPDRVFTDQIHYDTPILVLVTAPDDDAALDKAVAHIGTQCDPPVEWRRQDRDNRVEWSDPNREGHRIWLFDFAQLPPGDEPQEGYKTTYDLREVKHPFVRPNQRAAAEYDLNAIDVPPHPRREEG